MSRGNILQGQASGKLGDTVLMVRNGQQLARVYTTSGARSGSAASESARVQRVKFGAASNQWNAYRYVCTRMYRKGRSSNQSDYNYFVKRNQTLLPYLTKQENSDGVRMLQPGVFSEGTLGRLSHTHIYDPEAAATAPKLRINIAGHEASDSVMWSSLMSVMKSELSKAFPGASKVTYLFSIAIPFEVETEAASELSQNITHYPVVIDLLRESVPGEDLESVASYFDERIPNEQLNVVIEAQDGPIVLRSDFLQLKASDRDMTYFLEQLGVLIFATNDKVSDCYTTVLPESAIDPIDSVYQVWADYRTSTALRRAAESYGYQSGVMRDDVAAVGSPIEEAAAAYAATLREIDPALAARFEARAAKHLAEPAASPAAGASSEK